jgi:hypothetical protein
VASLTGDERRVILASLTIGILLAIAVASRPAPSFGHESLAAGDIAGAVDAFVATLSPSERARAVMPVASERRTKWHFLPGWIYDRSGSGVRLGDLTDSQRTAVHRLLQVALSDRGYAKATAIVRLDDLLRELSLESIDRDGPQPGFGRKEAEGVGSEHYWMTVFRDDRHQSAWGWRLEGHHLSLNFTAAAGLVIGTPTFMGSDPAHVPSGRYAGWRALVAEEDLGRRLIQSLTPSQNQRAFLSAETPMDVIVGPRGAGRLDSLQGIAAASLDSEQQRLLHRIVETYVGNVRDDVARTELQAMERAGFGRVHVAWAGSLESGKPLYYRVHGPTLVIEFDNPDNNSNHIHSVWHGRDDFGVDLLARHYRESPHHREPVR